MTTERKRPCAGMPRPRESTKRGFYFWGASAGDVPARCPANSKKQERNKTMKKIISAATAAALCALAGCYIGKAEFKGEDMKMYPFFGTSAVPIE